MNTHQLNVSQRASLLHLLQTVALQKGNFILASGEQSDTYLDVRKVALDSRGSYLIGSAIIAYIQEQFPGCRGVGGLTLGADPIVSSTLFAAHALAHGSLAGILVRKKPKDHGTMNWLEVGGEIQPGQDSILVVDDVITTGNSTLKAVQRIRDAGYHVPATLCVVDRQQGGPELLEANGLSCHSLYTLDEVLGVDEESEVIEEPADAAE